MSQFAHTQVFTTGQISKICQVAPRTVSKWFDTGHLRGYRIPGSNDRRVPRENLVEFMVAHGLPLGPLAVLQRLKVLLVGADESLRDRLQAELPATHYDLAAVSTAFEAGTQAAMELPACVIVDAAIGRVEAEGMARGLRSGRGERTPLLIALLSDREDADEPDAELFHDRFRAPFDLALLAGRIRQLAERARPPA